MKAGQTLLVLGAAGGVGIAAVEIGKALGARVIAAVSSEEKAQAARDSGADEAVVYPTDTSDPKALSQTFKDAVGPAGADVILDPVGGAYSEAALRSIAWEGRFLVVGFPAGIARLPLNLTLLKSCDVCGVFWGAFAARDPRPTRRTSNNCSAGGTRARSRRASVPPIRWNALGRRSRRCATARPSASWSSRFEPFRLAGQPLIPLAVLGRGLLRLRDGGGAAPAAGAGRAQ